MNVQFKIGEALHFSNGIDVRSQGNGTIGEAATADEKALESSHIQLSRQSDEVPGFVYVKHSR